MALSRIQDLVTSSPCPPSPVKDASPSPDEEEARRYKALFNCVGGVRNNVQVSPAGDGRMSWCRIVCSLASAVLTCTGHHGRGPCRHDGPRCRCPGQEGVLWRRIAPLGDRRGRMWRGLLDRGQGGQQPAAPLGPTDPLLPPPGLSTELGVLRAGEQPVGRRQGTRQEPPGPGGREARSRPGPGQPLPLPAAARLLPLYPRGGWPRWGAEGIAMWYACAGGGGPGNCVCPDCRVHRLQCTRGRSASADRGPADQRLLLPRWIRR